MHSSRGLCRTPFCPVCASPASVCLFVCLSIYKSVPLCCGQCYGPHYNSSGESDECFSRRLPALFLAASPSLSSSSSPPLPLHSWPRAPRPPVQLSLVLDLTMCRRLHSPHMVPSSTRDRWTHLHAAWHSGIGHYLAHREEEEQGDACQLEFRSSYQGHVLHLGAFTLASMS